jgi:molybdopterin-guanine dinucleotide biosynthesis protein A
MERLRQPRAGTVGIVLAGGGSTRLASAAPAGKARLEFEGRTFLERVCAAVAAEVSRVIVVAAAGQDPPRVPGTLLVHDSLPAAGPLAAIRDGIEAAIAAATEQPVRRVVVASCDVPLLRPEVVRLLVEAAGPWSEQPVHDVLWTVPVVHGHRQVLLSAIDVRLLPRLDAWLERGRRDPRGLVEWLLEEEPQAVGLIDERLLAAADPDLASFADIDTPEDLRRLKAL